MLIPVPPASCTLIIQGIYHRKTCFSQFFAIPLFKSLFSWTPHLFKAHLQVIYFISLRELMFVVTFLYLEESKTLMLYVKVEGGQR